MTTTVGKRVDRKSGFPRLVGRVSSLGRHRLLVSSLVIAAIGGALLRRPRRFPATPSPGFYLVPVTLAALTLRVRTTVWQSACVCLGPGAST